MDPKEDVAAAAVREVKEETGIDAEFACIGAVRETHQGPFGTSDLYCVCVLKLAPHYGEGSLPEPTPEQSEIAAARWLDLETFLGSKWYAKGLYGEMLRSAAATAQRVAAGQHDAGLQVSRLPSLGGRVESLYHAGPLPSAKLAAKL